MDSTRRDLSQIKFTHWWNEPGRKGQMRAGLRIDEAKAVVIYEAMRRRPEVQKAWLDGKFQFWTNGWQTFTGFVVNNLPLPWPDLDEMTRHGIIEAMQSPLFLPPRGYSMFPDKSTPEKCQLAAMQPLRLPDTDDPNDAVNFVKHARLFEDAGFLIVAIDNKTNQSVSYGCGAISALPRSFRKADMHLATVHHLPPNISDADKQALMDKKRQGTLTQAHLEQMWDKYRQRTNNLFTEGKIIATTHLVATGKRKRKDDLVEEKNFDFFPICAQLEAWDDAVRHGVVPQSDFIARLRL